MVRLILAINSVCAMLLASSALAQGGPPGGPGGPGPGGNNNFNALQAAPEPAENPISEAKRVLGKILFWDEQLSSDNTVACGTCHKPAAGGADFRLGSNPGFDQIFGTADDVIGSPGIRALDANGQALDDPIFGHNPQVTGRATPSFLTSMFADSNFWDGRATDEFVDPLNPGNVVIATGGALESQAVGPILNSVEMAQADRSWEDVIVKLNAVEPLQLASDIPVDIADALTGNQSYPSLFAAAFGDNEITPVRIAFAIATYERTLVPNETPWDLYVEGNDNAMTAAQIAGWEDYINTPCANCHEPPLFSDDNFRNIGLRPSAEDLGLFEVTRRNGDRGEFKTPSLRNVGLRPALMHVGWITDVEDALGFYNAGTSNTGHQQFTDNQDGIPGSNLDINELDVFANDPVRRAQLVDFLTNGLTDPRVAAEAFPFDRPTLASERELQDSSALVGVTTDASNTDAVFALSVVNQFGLSSNSAFSADDVIRISAEIQIDPSDIGRAAELYCVVKVGDSLYAKSALGEYLLWNGDLASLPAAASKTLMSIEEIVVVDELSGMAGEFAVYVAYTTDAGVLVYNSTPMQVTVEP